MGELLHAPPTIAFDDPSADEYTQPFWDHTREGRLSAPRCVACGRFRFPPTRFCPHCRSKELEYVELPGTGTLYSFTVVRHPLRPDQADAIPYAPAIIEPDGAPGCRFVSAVVNAESEELVVGMPLDVVWHEISPTYVFPFWAPRG